MEPKMFCNYLTVYHGDKMPTYYTGSSSVEKVSYGYRGSVVSKKWAHIWNEELKQNPHLFETVILSYHSTRGAATREELRLQKENEVVTSDKWINEAYATVNGFFGRTAKGEDSPRFGTKASKETILKQKIALTDRNLSQEHKNNIGKNSYFRVMSEEDRKKQTESRRNGAGWGQNKGSKRTEETRKLQSEKAKNREQVECPHCNKVGPKPQMGRWHFDNCKEIK